MEDGAIELKVSGLRVEGLAQTKLKDFYLKISAGSFSQSADLILDKDYHKSLEPFRSFQINPTARLKTEIFAHRFFHRDSYIGTVEDSIQTILENSKTSAGTVSRSLNLSGGKWAKSRIQARLSFNVKQLLELGTADMDEIMAPSCDNSAQLSDLSSKLELLAPAEKLPDLLEDVSSIVDTWGSLLDRVQVFVDVCDKVAEVHPYAKMAWSILSVIPKTISSQVERDEKVKALVVAMRGVFDFVHMAEPLSKIIAHAEIIKSMTQQVTDCAYFIRHYAKKKGFWERTAKNLFSDVDSKIQDYLDKFKELQNAFQLGASREINIKVVSILDHIKTQGETLEIHVIDSSLERMQYSKSARYNPDKRCLAGTRQTVISEIVDWVNDPGASSIFLLTGFAGCGKSSIIHTVSTLFGEQRRLGSSFCFDRNDQTDRRPDQLFRTVARDLAYRDDGIKRALYATIKADESLLRTPSPENQFQKLILEPMERLETVGPILVLVDALDESAGDSRDSVLRVFAGGKFPPNIAFLIASRPEVDIVESLYDQPHVRVMRLDDVDRHSIDNDIRIFLESRLTTSRRVNITDAQFQFLVKRSEGLFQWASTVCRLILGDGQKRAGANPMKQLDRILSYDRGSSKDGHLDQLYHSILNAVVDEEPESLAELKLVLGRILIAMEPLSMGSLRMFFPEDQSSMEDVLPFLGSLLTGVSVEDVPVRPLHTSLRDFLLDQNRAGVFYIDTAGQHEDFSLANFRVMSAHLRFNICRIPTSYCRNSQLNESTVHTFIQPFLRYACIFWSHHLYQQISSELMSEAAHFMEFKFLFWLEVLSILGALEVAAPALSVLIRHTESIDPELGKLGRDVQRFIRSFGVAISQSAPHLYISALPLAPKNSLIRRKCLPSLISSAIELKTGALWYWQNPDSVLRGHRDSVTSVTFSPDGLRIYSCSYDQTIRVWNAETGVAIGGPLRGHENIIESVVVSPDGRRILSCSTDNTIRLWNAETAESIGVIRQSGVRSIAFSPDGRKFASGSRDHTIQIWNFDNGEPFCKPLRGHGDWVNAIAFSADGSKIVSASTDRTVRLWNGETGALLGKPLRGHSSGVNSVSFSPDREGGRIVSAANREFRVWNSDSGALTLLCPHTKTVNSVAFSPGGDKLVSGSADQAIYVWSTHTGDLLAGPMLGHTLSVNSVSFSPDGARIVSGSDDMTIRVWNCETEGSLATLGVSPLIRSSPDDSVESVAFSPDGHSIVSASLDNTIQIWDSETGEAIGEPLRGHRALINSVAFSPDGTKIVSGSSDRTVLVWEAKTGILLGKPISDHNESVTSVAFSPNGCHIASASNDGTIRLWEAETAAPIGELLRHGRSASHVSSFSFSPDGGRIVSSSYDWSAWIRLWDVERGSLIGKPKHLETAIRMVAFSPDGHRVISCAPDGTVQMWDATNDILTPLGGIWPLNVYHNSLSLSGAVNGVAFSPDGSKFVTGGSDCTVRVWNALTGEPLCDPLRGHRNHVNSVAFSPDGCKIVSASKDKTVRVWNWTLGTTSAGEGSPVQKGTSHFSADGSTFSSSVTLQPDGWIVGPDSELVLWIPEALRLALPLHNVQTVIDQANRFVTFDSSKFCHGTEWTRSVTEAWLDEEKN